MNTNNKFWIWFSRIESLTCVQKEQLLQEFKTPEKIWNLSENELTHKAKLEETLVKNILEPRYRSNLEDYLNYIKKNNIKIITILDEEYPESLKNIYDKPIVLYAKGNVKLLKEKSVAIVGCRDCSNYGKEVAENLSYNLSKENICIVSGLAKGIDAYSHKGALKANGNTVAVMGNGLDYIYPYENKELYERIIKNNGLIVTEYIIGTKPTKLSFPARNRIISGLSEAVVVVEAKEKSGSIITAEFGLEQGKEVFAVPGNINSMNSKETNNLIKDGASIVTDYTDVLACLK